MIEIFRTKAIEDEILESEFPPDTPGERIPLGGIDNFLDSDKIDQFYKQINEELDKNEKIKKLMDEGKGPDEIEAILKNDEKLKNELNGVTDPDAADADKSKTANEPGFDQNQVNQMTMEMQRPLDFIEKERNAHCRAYQHNDTQYVIDYIDFLYAQELVETDQDKCVIEKVNFEQNSYTTEITINDLYITNTGNSKRESKLGACQKMKVLLDEEYGNLVDFKMMLVGSEALKIRPKRNMRKGHRKRRKRVNEDNSQRTGLYPSG